MAILRKIILLVMPMALTACYEDFYPTIDTEPVLCINSLITAGEPVEVTVTRSWVYNSPTSWQDRRVDDATVKVFVNGDLQPDGYLASEGDEIHIVAESAKYGTAEASVTVPVAIPVEVVNILPETVSTWRNPTIEMVGDVDFNLYVSLSITDDPHSDNFFKLDFTGSTAEGQEGDGTDFWYPHHPYTSFRPGEIQYDAEPIFNEHIGVFESIFGDSENMFMFFSDRQFAGKDYTLRLNFRNGYYSVNTANYDPALYDCTITFELATISRSYYDRLLYIWHRDSGALGDMGDFGFAEPICGYSNVSTGAGVVAARSMSTCTISLGDYLESAFAGEGR
ncbi:MAG: DUF4249 domain-containing protein [Duncaniella sp.]|nr:DUF4249 domain-containing protein [Duncaniella sp.]